MDVFHWDCNLETGLKIVDEHHHELVNITNSLGELLSQDIVKKEDLSLIIKKLIDYTSYHFEEEEHLMQEYNVDIRHIDQHKFIHRGFLHDVVDLQRDFENGQLKLSDGLFHFLMNWLIYHILGSDMNMSRQIDSIKDGMTAKEAYEIEEKEADKSTNLLLNSLNNLFDQVSQRNKDLKKLNNNLEIIVDTRTKELNEANKKLYKQATTDVLTGLPNRRQAMIDFTSFWDQSIENNEELSCMMIDADNFKYINDNYGHDAGDIVLRDLAKELQRSVRNDDVVYRLGGDEFLIICPSTGKNGILNVAKTVLKKINFLNVKVSNGIWKGSISIGLASKTDSLHYFRDLIKQADLGVYNAKAAGKNCIRTS